MKCMCESCKNARSCNEYAIQMSKKRKRDRYSMAGNVCMRYSRRKYHFGYLSWCLINFCQEHYTGVLISACILFALAYVIVSGYCVNV